MCNSKFFILLYIHLIFNSKHTFVILVWCVLLVWTSSLLYKRTVLIISFLIHFNTFKVADHQVIITVPALTPDVSLVTVNWFLHYIYVTPFHSSPLLQFAISIRGKTFFNCLYCGRSSRPSLKSRNYHSKQAPHQQPKPMWRKELQHGLWFATFSLFPIGRCQRCNKSVALKHLRHVATTSKQGSPEEFWGK